MELGNKCTQPEPILLASGWEAEKIQFWLLFSSLSLSVPSSEQLQIAIQQKISMLGLSSAAFLWISCAHFSRYFWDFEKYLKIPCNKWCFHDYKQQLTGRLKQQPVLPKLCFWPTDVTWTDILYRQLVLMPGKSLVPSSLSPDRQVNFCHQPGGKLLFNSRCMKLNL